MRSSRKSGADHAAAAVEHARLWLPLGHEEVVADLPRPVRRMVAVARECGASVEPALAVAGDLVREQAATAAELQRVVKPAVAVARGLGAMPLVVVPLLAWVLDLDLVAFFTRDPVGRVVGIVVAVMMGVAVLWLRGLVAAATRSPRQPAGRSSATKIVTMALLGGVVGAVVAGPMVGAAVLGAVVWWHLRQVPPALAGLDEVADLVATAVAAGMALPQGLRVAATHLPDDRGPAVARLALQLELLPPDLGSSQPEDRRPATGTSELGELERLCRDLAAAGRPAAPPLRRLARRLRDQQAGQLRLAVARLPGQLTFPTALLLVPATVLAIGAPIAMRGLAAVNGL